jgi:hypothetical protein
MSLESSDRLNSFVDTCASSGAPVEVSDVDKVDTAMGGIYFGPFLADLVDEAVNQLNETEPSFEPVSVRDAVIAISTLYSVSERYYRLIRSRTNNEYMAAPEKVWAGHLQSVRQGEMVAMPDGPDGVKYNAPARMAQYQNLEADRLFSRVGSDVQYVSSALNHQRFGVSANVLTAEEILDEDPVSATHVYRLEPKSYSVLNNWVISRIVQRLVETTALHSDHGKVRLLDIGLGKAATLGAFSRGISEAIQYTRHRITTDDISMMGIEATPNYINAIKLALDEDPLSIFAGLEMTPEIVDASKQTPVFKPNTASIVVGDAVTTIEGLDIPYDNKDLLIVTANHTAHEISTHKKRLIYSKLANYPNVIVIIAGPVSNLSQNGLAYYDLSNYGPLTPGDNDRNDRLSEAGFEKSFTLGRNGNSPSFMDPKLMSRVVRILVYTSQVKIGINGPYAKHLYETS